MTLLAATMLLVPVVLVVAVFALVAAKRHQPDPGNPVLPASQPRARTQLLRNWRYHLSFLVPMPFTSTYGVWHELTNTRELRERPPDNWEHAFWVQWRSRIWLYRTHPVDPPSQGEGGSSSVEHLWRRSGFYFDRFGNLRSKGGRLPYANAPP